MIRHSSAARLQYAPGTETEATGPYTTSIPAKTEARTYHVWYSVKGDDNHLDTKPDHAEVTIGLYRSTSGDSAAWMKSSGLPLIFRIRNSSNDSEAFGNFKGVKVDGKPLTNGQQYEASRGSVVIELKPVYLETLSVGEQALTAEFKDGRAEAG